jgi:hypothetical protein
MIGQVSELWREYLSCHWLIQVFALFGFIDFIFLVLRTLLDK